MSESALEMENVSYIYPDGYVALQNVFLKVARGEKVAILGPNGAGKSTLLMHINGLYTPIRGNIRVLGKSLNRENLNLVRLDVGLVFQDPDDQLFCPTLWEDVCYGPLNMNLAEDEVKRRSENALKITRLEGYRDKAPHHLSAGEKKRAAIATVLAMNPKILVLDEPTANLDPKSRLELVHILRSLNDSQGMTLIVATHDVNFVPMVADRAYVLNKGRILADGSLKQIFSNRRIIDEACLEPPIVAQLFCLLNEHRANSAESLPLTVEEAFLELTQPRKCSERITVVD